MRPNIAPALALIILLIFASPFLAGSKNESAAYAPHSTQAQPTSATKPKGPPPLVSAKHPIVAQSAEGGMWRTDGSFSPTFMLKNLLEIVPINVTPILYMADGTEYDLPAVQLDMAGVAMINIKSALQSAPADIQPHISAAGSAGIRYQWVWPAIFGAVLNRDQPRSLVYQTHLESDTNFTHNLAAQQSQHVVESTWWKVEPNVSGFLSLTNTALNPISLTVKLTDGLAKNAVLQQYNLAPHATEWIDLPQLWSQLPTASAAGGIEISYTGPVNAISTSGGLEDPDKGYSQMLHFSEAFPMYTSSAHSAQSQTTQSPPQPAQPQTTALDSTGIMMGAQDPDMQFPAGTVFAPYLVLRNATTSPARPFNLR